MDAGRRARVEQIFLEALERPEEDRAGFIERACGDDTALLVDVIALLDAHAGSGLLDGGPAVDVLVDPERIGPYRILQTLGEGGMGIVYEAEQTEPVRRRVAIKVIKVGMDTRQVVARFEAERQALAVMEHPNIARVLDAGATETGRPYFVMELVRGVPITRYCDEHKLTTEARLALFATVCRAVQHAHLKGVIHRDLKPSNVLVAVHDDRPVAKIIDFGIAKAVGPSLTEHTLVTRLGQFIGTPAYMSPEQAAASNLDIDTRADVYSLGVMLYELLVGTLPFDLTAVPAPSLGEAIRTRDAPAPSSRLTTLPGDTQRAIAAMRLTDLRALKRRLRGDLDWVVMKAIEKDRTRRYDTAVSLAADVERVLADEPVTARPPSASYRLAKLARRHRGALVGAAAVLLALLGGAVTTTVGWIRADRAETAARVEARTAERVSEFLVDLFEVSDPGEALGSTITAREILDQGAARIGPGLDEEPAVRARLMAVMGEVYRKLGLYDRADSLLVEALATRRGLHRSDHAELAQSINDLAELRQTQARFEEAAALYDEAIAMRRRLGPEAEEGLATSLSDLGLLHYARGELEEGETRFREALAMRRRLLEADDPALAASHNNLGGLLTARGEFEEAETHLREALRIWRAALGDDHPSTSSALNNLGQLLARQDRLEEAEPLLREVLELRRRLYEPGHPSLGTSLNNLGSVLRRLGDPAAAEPLIREALAIQRATTGSADPRTGLALRNLGGVLVDLERHEEAEPLYLEALEVFEATLGPDHAQSRTTHDLLAALYETLGRPDAAARHRERGAGSAP